MKTELMTPREWRAPLAGYIAHISSARSKGTCKLRSYHLRRFATSTGLAPRAVTHDDLVVYIGSNAWGKSTRHVARTTFRDFFLWAHRVARIVDDNPADLLPSGRPDVGEPRPAAEDDWRAALEHADPRVQLMIRLGATMGLRCCEIAKVHTGDMRQDILGDWLLRVRGKGERVRDVEVPSRLALELRLLEPGYLFPGNDDGHLSAAYVSKLVSRALPPGVTAHMLRHRFASVAYTEDRDIRAVQKLLGHRSVATTEIYTKVVDTSRRRAVERAAA